MQQTDEMIKANLALERIKDALMAKFIRKTTEADTLKFNEKRANYIINRKLTKKMSSIRIDDILLNIFMLSIKNLFKECIAERTIGNRYEKLDLNIFRNDLLKGRWSKHDKSFMFSDFVKRDVNKIEFYKEAKQELL